MTNDPKLLLARLFIDNWSTSNTTVNAANISGRIVTAGFEGNMQFPKVVVGDFAGPDRWISMQFKETMPHIPVSCLAAFDVNDTGSQNKAQGARWSMSEVIRQVIKDHGQRPYNISNTTLQDTAWFELFGAPREYIRTEKRSPILGVINVVKAHIYEKYQIPASGVTI